jgi:hypothetical protein
VLLYPIGDANCLKCHQDVTQRGYTPKAQIPVPGRAGGFGEREGGRNNHWHEFLARWQATSSTAGTGSTAQAGFMNAAAVQQACEACHQVLRREGEG